MPEKQKPVDQSRAESLRSLCAAAQSGDQAAFDEIHRRLAGGLRRFLVRRGARDEAVDDLAQRAWLAAWQALRDGRYDPQRAAITTFLYGIAYKVWLQHARGGRGDAIPLDALDQSAHVLLEHHDPAEFIRSCELLDAVRSCIASDPVAGLSPDDLAIVQGIAHGESERDMARRLQLAPSTINGRKRLLLRRLRDCLARKGFAAEAEQVDSEVE